jgi:hypothetical protein
MQQRGQHNESERQTVEGILHIPSSTRKQQEREL